MEKKNVEVESNNQNNNNNNMDDSKHVKGNTEMVLKQDENKRNKTNNGNLIRCV